MANTEILNALKLVRTTEDAVTKALDRSGLKPDQREVLENLADVLNDLDTFLLTVDLKTSVTDLEEKADKLTELNKQAQKSLAKLTKLADVINDVAVGIDGLTQAFKTLLGAGLV